LPTVLPPVEVVAPPLLVVAEADAVLVDEALEVEFVVLVEDEVELVVPAPLPLPPASSHWPATQVSKPLHGVHVAAPKPQ
jgi:hypothetical protein